MTDKRQITEYLVGLYICNSAVVAGSQNWTVLENGALWAAALPANTNNFNHLGRFLFVFISAVLPSKQCWVSAPKTSFCQFLELACSRRPWHLCI